MRLPPGDRIDVFSLALDTETGNASWEPVSSTHVPAAFNFGFSDDTVQLLDADFDKRTDAVPAASAVNGLFAFRVKRGAGSAPRW